MLKNITRTSLGFLMLSMGAGAFAQATEVGQIEIGMESRNYNAGQGFPLNFNGPIKVTSIEVLTQGAKNATLEASVNGSSAAVTPSPTYQNHWSPEWKTIKISNPSTSEKIWVKFGKVDPKIDKMIVNYEAEVRYQIKEVIKKVNVYIPTSQLGDVLNQMKGQLDSLIKYFPESSPNGGLFKQLHHLMFFARPLANSHEASDPDRKVGMAVDNLLNEFACDGIRGIFGTMAYNNPGQIANEIEAFSTNLMYLADMRRYSPVECSGYTKQWLLQNGQYYGAGPAPADQPGSDMIIK